MEQIEREFYEEQQKNKETDPRPQPEKPPDERYEMNFTPCNLLIPPKFRITLHTFSKMIFNNSLLLMTVIDTNIFWTCLLINIINSQLTRTEEGGNPKSSQEPSQITRQERDEERNQGGRSGRGRDHVGRRTSAGAAEEGEEKDEEDGKETEDSIDQRSQQYRDYRQRQWG